MFRAPRLQSWAATLHNLAYTIAAQGRHRESEHLFRQTLNGRRRLLGDDHPATSTTRHMLALVIADQGRHAEAVQLLRQALASQERVLGSQHPDTQATRQAIEQMTTSHGQAGTYPAPGRYQHQPCRDAAFPERCRLALATWIGRHRRPRRPRRT